MIKQTFSLILITLLLNNFNFSQDYELTRESGSFSTCHTINYGENTKQYIVTTHRNNTPTNQQFILEITGLDDIINDVVQIQFEPVTEFKTYSHTITLNQTYTVTASTLTTESINATGFETGNYTVRLLNTTQNTTNDIQDEKKYITFEKLNEFVIDDFTFQIKYCEQFFGGVDISSQNYIDATIDGIQEAFNRQVQTWNFYKNNTLDDDDKIYEIFIHPLWNMRDRYYYFWKATSDWDRGGCFYDPNKNVCEDNKAGYTKHTYRQNIYLTPKISAYRDSYSSEIQYSNQVGNIKSTISHEFFHGIQDLHPNVIMSKNDYDEPKHNYWLLEGMARFIPTIIYPDIEIRMNNNHKSLYSYDAKLFLEGFYNRLPKSFHAVSYQYCLFWRFLYENYGGDSIIKEALIKSGKPIFADINTNMDQALGGTGKFAEALIKFAKHIYFAKNMYGNWEHNQNNFYDQITPPANSSTRSDKLTTFTSTSCQMVYIKPANASHHAHMK